MDVLRGLVVFDPYFTVLIITISQKRINCHVILVVNDFIYTEGYLVIFCNG